MCEGLVYYERSAFNIINLMSELGGLAASLWQAFFVLGIFINHRYQTMYLIQDLFYKLKSDYSIKSKSKNHCLSKMVQAFTFNSNDKFWNVK